MCVGACKCMFVRDYMQKFAYLNLVFVTAIYIVYIPKFETKTFSIFFL